MGPSLFRDGNDVPAGTGRGRRGVASMGPSLFRDGNRTRSSSTPDSRLGLQWGRPFSGTEITNSTRRLWCSGLASMGPSLFRDGNGQLEAHHLIPRRLQWGRPFSGTEIPRLDTGQLAEPLASMGPSLFRDGNQSEAKSRYMELARLQWGRPFSGTEMTLALHTGRSAPSFNGAVPFQGRK